MASDIYDEFLDRYARSSDGAGTWTTDDLRLMLFTAFTFNATNTTITGVKNETSTESSNASPQALDNQTVAESGGTVTFDADDETFSAVAGGETLTDALVYLHVDGTDANDVPLVHLDIADTATNGGDITIQFNASGIVSAT